MNYSHLVCVWLMSLCLVLLLVLGIRIDVVVVAVIVYIAVLVVVAVVDDIDIIVHAVFSLLFSLSTYAIHLLLTFKRIIG